MTDAPGWPGIEPRWTSSAKSGVGTALSPLSRVWFTLSHGILNEVYYPRLDQACIRDLGFVVSDGQPGGLFAEEKRDCVSDVSLLQDGVPAYGLVNTHRDGHFRIRKQIVTDPRRDVVLQWVSLESMRAESLRLFAVLAPHLVNGGKNNTGWLGEYKGDEMLFAEGDGSALALAASCGWSARSAGFVGHSDGFTDISRNGRLTQPYDRAHDGNVALTGELALPESGHAVLALGFGRTWAEAAYRARSSLQENLDDVFAHFNAGWTAWQARLLPLDRTPVAVGHNTYRISTAVIRTHDSPSFPGGLIASLSIPWGASKGDDDLGGYHLVWPRDLVLTAGALLAAGANGEAIRVLDYLRAIQEADGHWPQNAWLDGTPYWRGLQLDECAFPILLLDLCLREGALPASKLLAYWPMARRAAAFVASTGPVTGQDRWEENPGFSPFTLAVTISALLTAAELADRAGEPPEMSAYLRDTADSWNASIESWCYARGTKLAQDAGVAGYYVRVGPDGSPLASSALDGQVPVKNRLAAQGSIAAWQMVSPDALALVRFGLRAADDPRILDTIKVVDRHTRQDLPSGAHWHRYNEDGYGEHEDGSPFDGTGIGRLWPLLTGERAHYLVAAGDLAGAERLLGTLEAGAGPGFMLPEQIWDSADIPALELFRGRPSGSAMPLVWAHGEHVKLLRSLRDGTVFDMPVHARQRYAGGTVPATPRVQPWRPRFRPDSVAPGRPLRVDLPSPSIVRWSTDGWTTIRETSTTNTGLGIHVAELDTATRQDGAELLFTWRTAAGQWAGEDYRVALHTPAPADQDGGGMNRYSAQGC